VQKLPRDQSARLAIQPFQTIAEDIFSVGPKRSVIHPLTALPPLEIPTYLLTYNTDTRPASEMTYTAPGGALNSTHSLTRPWIFTVSLCVNTMDDLSKKELLHRRKVGFVDRFGAIWIWVCTKYFHKVDLLLKTDVWSTTNANPKNSV